MGEEIQNMLKKFMYEAILEQKLNIVESKPPAEQAMFFDYAQQIMGIILTAENKGAAIHALHYVGTTIALWMATEE